MEGRVLYKVCTRRHLCASDCCVTTDLGRELCASLLQLEVLAKRGGLHIGIDRVDPFPEHGRSGRRSRGQNHWEAKYIHHMRYVMQRNSTSAPGSARPRFRACRNKFYGVWRIILTQGFELRYTRAVGGPASFPCAPAEWGVIMRLVSQVWPGQTLMWRPGHAARVRPAQGARSLCWWHVILHL
jgi:hypothetical protein